MPFGASSNGDSPPRMFARAVPMDCAAVSGVRGTTGVVTRGVLVDVGVTVLVLVTDGLTDCVTVAVVELLPDGVGVRSRRERDATSAAAARVDSSETAFTSA